MNTISDTIRRISALPDNAEISDADAKILLDAAEAQQFFAAAAVVLLRHWSGSNDSERLADIRHRLALAAADRRTLLTAQHGDAWTKFYPEAADEMPPQTVDVIDTFLRTYGSCTPEEEAQLERLIFNPTPTTPNSLPVRNKKNSPARTTEPPVRRTH